MLYLVRARIYVNMVIRDDSALGQEMKRTANADDRALYVTPRIF